MWGTICIWNRIWFRHFRCSCLHSLPHNKLYENYMRFQTFYVFIFTFLPQSQRNPFFSILSFIGHRAAKLSNLLCVLVFSSKIHYQNVFWGRCCRSILIDGCIFCAMLFGSFFLLQNIHHHWSFYWSSFHIKYTLVNLMCVCVCRGLCQAAYWVWAFFFLFCSAHVFVS